MKHVTQLIEQRDSITSEVRALTERAADEGKDLTPEQLAYIATLQTRAGEIDGQLVTHNQILDSQRSYVDLLSKLGDQSGDQAKPERRNTPAVIETRSWGDMFVDSDAFKGYQGVGTSQRAVVPGLFETRAPIMTGGMGTAIPYVFTPAAYTYATPLMSVVGHVTVGANAVEWLRWTPNPQAAASIVAEGAVKPEAVMTPVPHSDTLDTYAHWKGVTRQALEDIPQIRSIVENRLRQGIMVALETAVATALGADTAIPPAEGAGDLLAAIRNGVAVVQAAGFSQPNTVLLNPADFAALDISVMRETNVGPQQGTGFWGMRAIGVPGLPVGTAYVGDFNAGVQIFDRGTTSLYMTDSHADMFISNIVLLLAEIRALVAITEPAAIAECTAGVAAGGLSARTASGK